MTPSSWSSTLSYGGAMAVGDPWAGGQATPGAKPQLKSTNPSEISMRWASSVHGSRPAEPTLSAAVTRATPVVARIDGLHRHWCRRDSGE